ncbi:MAG: hypothetical protein JW727_03955 [Candidatus Aenigmarchaeota archaeon]|nr:hypothetical protein [Candidatus Aenigmarchaeota archaeon]
MIMENKGKSPHMKGEMHDLTRNLVLLLILFVVLISIAVLVSGHAVALAKSIASSIGLIAPTIS